MRITTKRKTVTKTLPLITEILRRVEGRLPWKLNPYQKIQWAIATDNNHKNRSHPLSFRYLHHLPTSPSFSHARARVHAPPFCRVTETIPSYSRFPLSRVSISYPPFFSLLLPSSPSPYSGFSLTPRIFL